MKIFNDITEIVGNTPLLKIGNFCNKKGLNATIFAKLEYLNPAGSIKDRTALYMLTEAQKRGLINESTTIIEPTSGNTGIGLAAIGVSKGLKVILTMPETMSVERRSLLLAYGATVVLTEGAKGMRGAIEKANELKNSIPNSFIPSQFSNPANPKAHYETTGPEIWNDIDGKVDIFVAGVGTGGTISGAGSFLKSKNPNIKIIAVEPYDSPVLSEGRAGAHALQGIGANFVPEILDTKIYNEIVTVRTEEAFRAARELAKYEGILVGISSGAALHAATVLAERDENAGKNIVVILPDTGDRYLSTPMFSAE